MSTSTLRRTLFDTSALLVSDLPPAAPAGPGLLARMRERIAEARGRREFERHVRFAGHAEGHDLMTQSRRSS